jgi:hypothetical protein
MARSLISPYEAEARAQRELGRLGVQLGLLTRWKMKPFQDGISMGYDRSWRIKPKRRRGQHRGHTCSRTGGGNNKRRGN